ncbi:hypothetical protein N5T40_24310 [Escherichia coli]|uniref:GA-like domain-containing protein n=1 Tax=Escherichia coli TaxID=562 RepID=UPI002225FD84|nr:hypothetical protein [Escherichia coli]MCW3244204.1 hypothetical protein [Escherichia coli]
MKMIFTGKVSGEKTVLAAGDRHTVKAQAGEQYGLVDEVTGLVPDGVEADRSGDDLILRKKEDDTEIRIEGFWEECQPGETQCTAVFNVVGENGQVTEAVLTQDGPVLENFTAGQSGTLAEGINNGIIWGGIAFGAGLAAIALAAGGGGGSSRHKRAPEDEQKPVQPEGGQEAEKTEVSSTGSIEPGSGSSSDQVPEVNDQNGNGKPDAQDAKDAEDAAKALVEAAEAKQAEAEGALTEANKDGAINPDEHTELTAKNQAVTDAKNPAEAAVNALPEGDVKAELKGRLDAVDGISVPEVNDQNGNGKPDAQDAKDAEDAAKALVEAAEAKQAEAEGALTEANKDGAINPDEHTELTAKNQAVTDAKNPAEAAVNALPEGDVKAELKGRLDAVDGISVPEVNDQNGNGKPDAQDAKDAEDAAKALVEAAEAKQAEAEGALTEANKDGAINPDEHTELTAKNQAVTDAKNPAEAAVNALPEGDVKAELKGRLDAVDGISVPEVNDQNGNGKPDAQDAKDAEDAAKALVEAAEAKQAEAEGALTEANKDGAINPDEHTELTAKNQAVTDAKNPAEAAVNALPEGDVKAELKGRLDAVDGISVPEVNDQNGNGKPDAQDAKDAEDAAKALVEAAEAKQAEAEGALTEANKDGAINPDEHTELTAKNQAVTDAKNPAEAAVNALPEGDVKAELKGRLDAVDGISVPEVNDQNGNGKPDAQDAKDAEDAAKALVEAAEAKQAEAEGALTEANKDGAINPDEHTELTAKNQAVTDAKNPAEAAVNALPEGDVKAELKGRLDAVDGISVPEVNDQNGNGKPDAQDAKDAEDAAKALVEAAEAKQAEAEGALTEANKDGAINPDEHTELTAKNQAVTDAKNPAEAAVNALPEGDVKAELKGRLDAVDGISVPEVNDQNGNGKPDAQDAKDAEDAAKALVEAAEAKQAEAEGALTEANKDGAINPDEHTELTAKNQAVTDAKNPAEAAVNALPEGDVKAELKGRLDAVDGISVPEVNDQNGNGKPDAQDAKDAEDAAKALVEAAEAKQAEAEGALTEANKDGAINPDEHTELTAKNQAVTDAKNPAEAAVNALPEGDVKAELKGRLDAVDGISVPEVNDQNGNGKPDAQDAKDAEDAAKALVEAAEAKQAEAEGALTEANKDGAINPDEHTELTAKNQAVTDAKNPAEAAVNALPEGDVKAELKGRLDAVDGISVPEVNDQNGNGKPDAQDAKDAEDAAKALVEAAEAKQAEAEGALTEANKDGAINPDEHTELTAKNQAVTDAKNPAEAAVNALPEGDVKAELKGRLDAVDGISVPEVNDQNGNGKPDAQDAKDAEDAAKALVEAAEAKQAEAEGALTEANKDGAINPDEHTELTAKNQAVTDAKNPAEAAVNALPEGDVKAELKGRLDAVDGISVPEVNDQNGNGKPDAQDAKDAEDAAKALVEAAEAKQAEAEGALTEANKDGAINPDEHTELTAKNQAVTDAKNPAEAAVNALPEGDVKAELKGRLDAVDGISVPEVNDQNGNGKPDAQDAKDAEDAAKALVEAAEAKQAEAEGALTEANKDGAINPDEHTELTAKNQAVTDAKNPAEAAVNALPEGDVKAELKGRLDAVDGISVPEVNDQNGNGKPDAQDAKDAEDAAKALVEAAEAKQAEAEGALTEANKDGAINPDEHTELTAKNQAVTDAKNPAEAAVNALPEGDVKAELKGRLDAVDGISVPEVNDQNGNGKPDAQDAKDAEDAAKALVEAAEAKQAEAEGALTEANKDGAINPDEHTELTAKNQAVTDAKNPAEAAVNALPEGDVKAELKGRLDAVDGISVPEVNDQNGNGKPDAQDAKDAEDAAKALVEAAEAKQAEAEGALTEANKDGAINPDEHTELTAKNQAVTDAKNPAEAAVNALPEGDVKAELKGRLDAVDGISVPEVNDQNGNGKPDAQDAKDAEDAAKALVEAAEAKQAEAEGALTEANKDGAINPDEHTELTAKNQAVTDAKNPAEAAVNALPEGDVKAELKGRLDAVDGISVPEVNDQNGNGKPDAQDAKDAEDAAKALVEAAEAKQAEAEGALTEANKDGAINPDEHTELTAKNQAVTDAKNPAEAAVNALPEGDVKAELKGRLDAVDGISVPEVNDQNGNGKPDAQDAKDAEDAAKALVEAAEAKQAEAEGALTEANKDGAINPDEHTELTAKNQAVTDAKNPAEAAVNALPEGDVKAELKGRLDAVDGISVPEVNDQNGNGKPDAQDAKDAEDAAKALVEAAEAKQAEAEGALTEANKDGAINPDEHTELTAKNQAVTDAKNPAEAAVNALPEGDVKAELKGRLDAVDGISVPEVNDQNGNGKPDAQDAAAAVAFYERALPSNVSGDLYPQPSTFGDKVSSVSKNWSTLLDSNPGSYVTSQRLDSGANQYNYNGHTGSDVISIIDSLGGLDRTQASRFPVGLFTGEGNDLIVTGKDYGRNTSAGYTDHSHRTDMGNGDDTLVVGVGNNDVTLYVNEEGQLRATTDSYNGSTSIDYTGINSSSSGGTISGTDIVMGAGNDTVLALGYEGNSADAIINTNIDLGAGNDFIYANGEISTNNGTQVNIIGGEGFDTISLDNTTVTSAMFSGFEHVDLHSTSHLILNSDDFKSQDIEEGILKISGSSGASVDVQNFDWENLGSTNDGDVKYLTYQSSDIPGLTLWIQEGIEVK